jgi:hypothetical protein
MNAEFGMRNVEIENIKIPFPLSFFRIPHSTFRILISETLKRLSR